MKTSSNKTTPAFFPAISGDDTTLPVNLYHDLDFGPEDQAEIDLTGRPNIKRIQVRTVVHSSTHGTDSATAAAGLLRRQSYQAVDQMLQNLTERTSSQSIMNCLAELKEEVDFGITKLTKNREIERIEGNAAEILRCIRDAVTLTPAEEFCNASVVSTIRNAMQTLRAKAEIEPEDVRAFRAELRRMKISFNRLLFALKMEVNDCDYTGAQNADACDVDERQ